MSEPLFGNKIREVIEVVRSWKQRKETCKHPSIIPAMSMDHSQYECMSCHKVDHFTKLRPGQKYIPPKG